MAVLALEHHSPWLFSRWAFRKLLERSIEKVGGRADDEYALRQAIALDGLHLDLLEATQAIRLARAVGTSAHELRVELRASADPDQRDIEFADLLADVELNLGDIT